jgi:arylsulfatase A-like enzyme
MLPSVTNERTSLLGKGEVDRRDQTPDNKLRNILLITLAAGLATLLYISSPTARLQHDGKTSWTNNPVQSDVMNMKSSKSSSSSPNIVFILADDMGYNSINEDVSPFLYKLQKKGIELTSYYSQEACTPARSALMTGRNPLSIGTQFCAQGSASSSGLGLDETTVAEVIKSNGYTTYMLGKWNLGNASPRYLPTARGFDYYLGYLDGYTNYWSKVNPDYPDYVDFMYSDSECYYMYDGDDLNDYSTTIFQDSAVAAIGTHDFDDSPLFLYVAFQATRDPWSGKLK